LEVQLADSQRQLEEANRQHEQIVRAIKSSAKESTCAQPDQQEESLEEKVIRL
jgi:hypothetical protein